jgi:hypothetical protein
LCQVDKYSKDQEVGRQPNLINSDGQANSHPILVDVKELPESETGAFPKFWKLPPVVRFGI